MSSPSAKTAKLGEPADSGNSVAAWIASVSAIAQILVTLEFTRRAEGLPAGLPEFTIAVAGALPLCIPALVTALAARYLDGSPKRLWTLVALALWIWTGTRFI